MLHYKQPILEISPVNMRQFCKTYASTTDRDKPKIKMVFAQKIYSFIHFARSEHKGSGLDSLK